MASVPPVSIRYDRLMTLVVVACSFPGSAAILSAGPEERQVDVVRIDGTTESGEWIGIDVGQQFQIRTSWGQRAIPLDDLATITFQSSDSPAQGSVLFHLADGGTLRGELVGTQGDAVLGRTMLGSPTRLGFDRLAAIQLATEDEYPQAAEMFADALGDRRVGQDVLVTRSVDDAKALFGRLESLTDERGVFEFGRRSRTIQTEKIFGLVFATGVGDEPKYQVSVQWGDGSQISGQVVQADGESLKIATSLGFDANIPIGMISRIRVHSDRVVYLSDLTPTKERVEGRLHAPWPVRRDRSASGAVLSISGRAFDKGLGVHSYTELIYDIGGKYARFAVTVGIDDAVRPLGRVAFRVLDGARVLFESGVIGGRDAPRDIVVDVSGVKYLTLIVDYGDGLDLSDHADWGDARLLKPPSRETADRPTQ